MQQSQQGALPVMNPIDEQTRPRTLSELLEREAVLVAEITSMRQQIKAARYHAHVQREPVDPDWMYRVHVALIARRKELAGLRVERISEQRRLKDARHQREIDMRLSLQAAFIRQAKRLLSKKVYGEIKAAARQAYSMQ